MHNPHPTWFRPDFRMAVLAFMIAFVTWNSNLVPLLEGLCTSNPCRFEFSVFFWIVCRNRTDDLRTASPTLWPTELVLHRYWHPVSCATIKSYPSSTSAKNPFRPPHSWSSLETASGVPSLPSTARKPLCYKSWLGLGFFFFWFWIHIAGTPIITSG